MSAVLITGSTGFVGNNLIDYLHDKGIEISVLNRKFHYNEKITRSYIWDDFNQQGLKNIDTIIHLAGKAHDVKNTSNPDEYFDINTGLTKVIFDLFLKNQVSTFIYFSSVKAVADTVNGILYEDVEYLAKTPYGQSKQKAEEYLKSKPVTAGKRVFILRPCMIHGPGNKGNLNLLYKFVLKQLPYPLAGFKNLRSFLSIDNLTYVIEKIVKNTDFAGGIYNMADDEPLSTNAVISLMAGVTGNKPKLWNINTTVISIAAKIGDVLHLPLNSERLKKLTESYVVSNKKIVTALNITLPVSSSQGVIKTIKSFQLNN